MPVRWMNEARRESDENEDGDDLDQHHDVVGLGGLTNASHENHGEDHHDDECGPVEAEVPSGRVERVALKVAEAAGQVGGSNPAETRVDAEPIQEIDDVGREANANGHVA